MPKFVVQKSRKPKDSNRGFLNRSASSNPKSDLREVLFGSDGLKEHKTQSYYVQINELDRHSSGDPSQPRFSMESEAFPHFKESHPSLFMPKHKYKRYKMVKESDHTGLGINKQKPPKQFAIQKLLSGDSQAKANES